MKHLRFQFLLLIFTHSSKILAQLPSLYEDASLAYNPVATASHLFVWKNELYMNRTYREIDGDHKNFWKFNQNQTPSRISNIRIHEFVTADNYMMFSSHFPSTGSLFGFGFTKTGNDGDFTYTSFSGHMNHGFAKNDTFYISMTSTTSNYTTSLWRVIPNNNIVDESNIEIPYSLKIEKHYFYKNDIYLIGSVYGGYRHLYRLRNNQLELIRSNVYNLIIHENDIYASSYAGNYDYVIEKGAISSDGIISWKILKYYYPAENFVTSQILKFMIFKNKVYFPANLPNIGTQLCTISNDTIKAITQHNYFLNDIYILGEINSKIIFTSRNIEILDKPNCLWGSDGTALGTKIIANNVEISDLPPYGPGSRIPTIFQNRFFFKGRTNSAGEEPWYTDGTPEGTKMLMDINPGVESSYPTDFMTFKNRVYFVVDEPVFGHELWYLDPNCFSEKNLSGESTQDEGVREFIYSTQKIIKNSNREYKASKALQFNPGFEVQRGATFKTTLDYGCEY